MENDTRPHIKPNSIKYTKGFGVKLFVSKLIRGIIILTTLAAITSTVFIYIKEPIKTNNGYIFAEKVHGSHETGDKVIVVDNNKLEVFSPLIRAVIIQEPEYMEVIAGPYGEIKKTDEKNQFKAIYGPDTVRVNLDIAESRYLDNEYIVRLLQVNNEADFDIIVKKTEIAGLINKVETYNNNQTNKNKLYSEPKPSKKGKLLKIKKSSFAVDGS